MRASLNKRERVSPDILPCSFFREQRQADSGGMEERMRAYAGTTEELRAVPQPDRSNSPSWNSSARVNEMGYRSVKQALQ